MFICLFVNQSISSTDLCFQGPAKPGEASGLSNGDKVTLYLEIAEAHRMLNQTVRIAGLKVFLKM